MAKGTLFIGWIAGGTGIVLLYSAYKNKSPFDVLKGTLTQTPTTATIDPNNYTVGVLQNPTVLGSVPDQSSVDILQNTLSTAPSARIQAIANRTKPPTLAPIPTQPNLLMDYEAVASFMLVQAQYGKPIILDNTYRTLAQQTAAYNKVGPDGTFGKPGTSLHEVGLALDIKTNASYLNDPALIKAFQDHGWYRRGKVINGVPEPWHWTYRIPG